MRNGDIVRLGSGTWNDAGWQGLPCVVVELTTALTDMSYVFPLEARPDGFEAACFYWQTDDLTLAEDTAAAAWGECPPTPPEAVRSNPRDSQEGSSLARGVRMEEYGHPSVAFARIAELWSIYLDGIEYDSEESLLPDDVAKMMILLKVSRLVTDNKADTLDDITGYVECLRMLDE